jgi:hypothetical protein
METLSGNVEPSLPDTLIQTNGPGYEGTCRIISKLSHATMMDCVGLRTQGL